MEYSSASGVVRFSWQKSQVDGRFYFVRMQNGFSNPGAVHAVVDDFGNLVRVEW